MSTNDMTTEKIPVKLPNGAIIKLEVSDFGREDVSFDVMSFDDIAPALEGITVAIKGTIEKAKPKKASTVRY